MSRSRFESLLMVGFCLLLGACQPYTLRGRVVQGDISYITIVSSDDPRLNGSGVPGVQLDVTVDPGKLNRTRLPGETSGADGEVAIPIKKAGAGLLKYEVSLVARRQGFRSAESVFDLPKKDRRVLVVLSLGTDPYGVDQHRTVEDDLKQFGR